MGWTCDVASSVRCVLDSSSVDVLTTVLQGVFILAGAIIGLAVVVAFSSFWRRL